MGKGDLGCRVISLRSGPALPGWAIVRWVFNFIEKNRDAGIDEVAKEVKEGV